jgi:hypothetical protein
VLYAVNAMSVHRETGLFTIGGEPRVEIIDTDTNELFIGAMGRWEVEDCYHAFWNRLNPEWEDDPPGEMVVVLSVTPVEE